MIIGFDDNILMIGVVAWTASLGSRNVHSGLAPFEKDNHSFTLKKGAFFLNSDLSTRMAPPASFHSGSPRGEKLQLRISTPAAIDHLLNLGSQRMSHRRNSGIDIMIFRPSSSMH